MSLKTLLFAATLFSLPVFTQAQTVVNPSQIEFTTPSNYADVDGLGQPIVVGLTWNAIGMNSNGAVAVTVGMGKPAGGNAVLLTLPLPGMALLSVNKLYTGTVTATGQSGTTPGVSDPSNPFGVAALTDPAKPSSVRVK